MQRKLIQSLVLSLIFSALGLAWVIYKVGSAQELALIKTAPPLALVYSLLALLLSFVLSGLRIRLLVQRLGHKLNLFYAIRIHILGIFSANVTPGGSGSAPAIAFSLQYQGVEKSKSWAVAVALFTSDTLFLSWSLPLTLIIVWFSGLYPAGLGWLVMGISATLITSFMTYVLAFRLEYLYGFAAAVLRGPFVKFREQGLAFVRSVVKSNRLFAEAPVSWYLLTQVVATASWIAYFSVLFFVARGFATTVGFWLTQAWQLMVTALSFTIPTPGGSGFIEFGMSFLLLNKGNDGAAPAIIVLWRLLTYYLFFVLGPLLGGYMFLKRLQDQSNSPSQEVTHD